MTELALEAGYAQPASEIFWGELGPCDHVLHIYEDEEVFLDSLHDFLWAGFQANEAVIVIATEQHLAGLDERIQTSGVEPEKAKASGRYFAIDADEALSNFLVDDWPDSMRFQSYVQDLLTKAR